VEHEQETAGISRGQNQLHVLPEDREAAESVVSPLLERADAASAVPQIVVVTNDADFAAAVAGRLAPVAAERDLRTLAVTDARRAARVQRSAPAHLVIGPAAALVALLQSAVLKLDGVRAIVLAWVDDVKHSETAALETLMSEIPKDAARVVVVNAVTTTVEQLVERYARRARRVQPAGPESLAPVALSYLAVSEAARIGALRRVLDAVDPESAFVVTRSADSRDAVEAVLRSLGYDGRSNAVRAGDVPDAPVQLIVLYDLPATQEELRRLTGEPGAARIVALVTPRQIAALKRFAGGAVSPLSLPEAAARARSREDNLRDELRAILATGQFSRELFAIESLLSEYDGAEIAAAALRLLEAERAKPATPSAPAGQAAMTRLYLNVGEMDNVRPGDLVGAITNEAGISRSDMGRVDVRERHSTVEVATPVANNVVSKITGATIKGRRVLARVDEQRESRGRPERSERPDRPQRPRRDDARTSGSRGGPGGRGGGGPRKR
jgi:ATP-dependent RNA helicase DeaD